MKISKLKDKTEKLSIAVDGEAGAGKGTVCKKIADEYSMLYCQSSIFYRKLAFISIKNSLNEEQITNMELNHRLFDSISEDKIYSEEVTEKASIIAANKTIREALVEIQREVFERNTRVIMEGRDIGTIIAPNAMVKLYIKASLEVRAKRRYSQYIESGLKVNLEEIKNNLYNRDKRDKERENAPLRIADDAIVIDNSNMNREEFYFNVINAIEKKLLENNKYV